MTELSRECTLTLVDLNRLPLPLDFTDSACMQTLIKLGFAETYNIKDTGFGGTKPIQWLRITNAGKLHLASQTNNIRVVNDAIRVKVKK